MFWLRKKTIPSVTFATTCWERDWRIILHDPEYLRVHQMVHHRFPFAEKILIINNVSDLGAVKEAAQRKVDEGVITRFVVADQIGEEVFSFFQLKRSDFATDWLYYNALGPLAAIYSAQSDYLLYMTGDVWLPKSSSWIGKALRRMAQNQNYKVANLTWNNHFKEAKRESHQTEWNFYVSKIGFSDQMFLVRKSDFCRPMYGEIRLDTDHFPWGDTFEKRVLSYMKNRGWERITYRYGSYTHA